MKTPKSVIDRFLEPKRMAIAGVSRNEKKFGFVVYKELKEKGFTVYPVNPNTSVIGTETCYTSVNALPESADRLMIITKKPKTIEVLKSAHEKGIRHVWIQQMSETPEAIAFAKEKFETVIAGQCIMMFADPVVSVHKFHRRIKGFFGMLPK